MKNADGRGASRLALPAAATAEVAAVAHVPLIRSHLQEAPYVGVLFVGLVLALTVVAILLVVADREVVWLAAAVLPGSAVLAYVLSRTTGLPQLGDDVGNWTEPLGVVALTAELLTVALALAHRTRWAARAWGRPAVVALLLLALGLAATGRAAASTDEKSHPMSMTQADSTRP